MVTCRNSNKRTLGRKFTPQDTLLKTGPATLINTFQSIIKQPEEIVIKAIKNYYRVEWQEVTM